MLPLLAFCVLYVCAYAGEPVRYAYLPLYMSEQLHLPGALSGAVIGIQPLVELALMPLVVILARRTGPWIPMIAGALFGVAANLCFALTGTVVGLFAGQILMGGVWGVFAALGIIVAQSLLPTAIATATAVFLTAPALSSALGGSVGGIFAQAVGLPAVFFVPATFGLIAVAGFAVMAARLPHLGTRRAPSGQPEDIRLTTTQPD
jgi:SET family sugar efflux transporter-like MFS transporter